MFKRLDKDKQINFNVGRIHFPQGETATQEKPAMDIHFLGIRLQILRSGKFTKVTLSTD